MLRIILEIYKQSGEDSAELSDEYIIIKIHATSSQRKIKEILAKYLLNHKYISAQLCGILARVASPAGRGNMRAECSGIPALDAPKRPYSKAPLPISLESAITNAKLAGANPIVAQLQANVVADSEKLFLENC
jgi:hypothetical protein